LSRPDLDSAGEPFDLRKIPGRQAVPGAVERSGRGAQPQCLVQVRCPGWPGGQPGCHRVTGTAMICPFERRHVHLGESAAGQHQGGLGRAGHDHDLGPGPGQLFHGPDQLGRAT